MPLKPGPKPIAKSTGKPDQRRRDNKQTPKNTPELKPHKHKKGDWATLVRIDNAFREPLAAPLCGKEQNLALPFCESNLFKKHYP